MTTTPVSVVYIAGLGHSGSTLLDLLLSAHSGIFSVGEIVNLRAYAHMTKVKSEKSRLGNECTCGAATIWQCSFWTRVEEVLTRDHRLSLRDLDLRDADADRQRRENLALFSAVAQVSGCSVVVDSSKDPRRLKQLLGIGELRILPVHLIRDARGVVYSQLRRGRGLLAMCLEFNRRSLQIRRSLRGVEHHRVRYEQLAREPETVLRSLMGWLQVPCERDQMDWAVHERHNLGGNWIRRSEDSTIRPDTSWRAGLSAPQRLATSILTAPARLALGSD